MTKKPVNLFSVDTWKGLFDQALSVEGWLRDPSQMSAKAGAALENLGDTSHELEAEKINAIKQKTSKGFKITDINPNYLNRADFYCVYDDNTMFKYLGSDFAFEESDMKYDNEGSPNANQRTQSPYFRTVQIPIEGDWVKIEYLPVRRNVPPATSFSVAENIVTDPTVEPQNTLEIDNSYTSSATFSSDSPILLEFENVQGRPHIVRSGDSFETYFTYLIITVKQNSPPLRVTVGFNSRIHSAGDNTPSSLSLWKGNGLLKESSIQTRAWNICDRDTNGPSNAGYTYSGSLTDTLVLLVSNTFDSGLGLHVGWITEFSATALCTTAADLNSCDVELVVRWSSTARIVERLATLTLAYGTGALRDQARWQCSEPIRYQLRDGEELYLRITAARSTPLGSPSTALIKFSVSGYSIGRLEGTFPHLSKIGFLAPVVYLTENPYPVDLERYGAPKS